jgi:hypothetical protein
LNQGPSRQDHSLLTGRHKGAVLLGGFQAERLSHLGVRRDFVSLLPYQAQVTKLRFCLSLAPMTGSVIDRLYDAAMARVGLAMLGAVLFGVRCIAVAPRAKP